MVTKNETALLQASYARMAARHRTAAQDFYGRLLAIAPELRPAARHELGGNGQMFMATLGMLVRGLCETPALLPVAASLAERYLTFGADAERLPRIGEALLATIADTLGDDLSAEAQRAWALAYDALCDGLTDTATASAA